jgi:GNAT superfamily N-acetyltransferase
MVADGKRAKSWVAGPSPAMTQGECVVVARRGRLGVAGEVDPVGAQPSIRPASPSDIPAVLRLIRGLAAYERLLHEFTATEADLDQALFGPLPRIHAILAESDGHAVGIALFYYSFSTFTARANIFLEDLFVDPAYRGRGFGLALMRHIAQRAVAENCRRIEWRVLNWNQPSIDFYQRLGAEPIEDWHTRQLGGDALVALAKGIAHG